MIADYKINSRLAVSTRPKRNGSSLGRRNTTAAPEMASLRYEDDRLVEVSDLDAKPTLVLAFHVRTDEPSGKFLIPVSAKPTDPTGADRCPGPYQALTGELIEVELKPVLETCSVSGFWHQLDQGFGWTRPHFEGESTRGSSILVDAIGGCYWWMLLVDACSEGLSGFPTQSLTNSVSPWYIYTCASSGDLRADWLIGFFDVCAFPRDLMTGLRFPS